MSAVLDPFCDLVSPFVPCEFRLKWATAGWEQREAHRLRRAVFCIEQGIFVGDDLDAIDETNASAQTIVAISCVGGMSDQVVGTVRIHEDAPGLWWGSRLAVHPTFRRHGRLGAGLIQLAVGSAHARGARLFLAHVQSQNLTMFQRLHWTALREESLHGRPHHLMQADLAMYPAMHDPIGGFVTRSKAAA